jgi:hypothetical protein
MTTYLEKLEAETRYIVVWAGNAWEVRDEHYRDRYGNALVGIREKLTDAADVADFWNAKQERGPA